MSDSVLTANMEAAALAAFEFGFRCAEKHMNIQQARAEFHKVMNAPSVAGDIKATQHEKGKST